MESNQKLEVLVIDNYDSFVYNLVHYLEDLDCTVTVRRNDSISLEEIEKFEYIVLSPGPGLPSESGILKKIIAEFASTKKILGVCLGLQAMAEIFGGTLKNLNQVFHGVSTTISIEENEQLLFKNLSRQIEVGRYHSWVIDELPNCFLPTSFDDEKNIMSISHQEFNLHGVQFHPESIMTPNGKQIIKNWLETCRL